MKGLGTPLAAQSSVTLDPSPVTFVLRGEIRKTGGDATLENAAKTSLKYWIFLATGSNAIIYHHKSPKQFTLRHYTQLHFHVSLKKPYTLAGIEP
jgi:hypothetical protein